MFSHVMRSSDSWLGHGRRLSSQLALAPGSSPPVGGVLLCCELEPALCAEDSAVRKPCWGFHGPYLGFDWWPRNMRRRAAITLSNKLGSL